MGKYKHYIIDMQQYDVFFKKKVINIFALKIFFLLYCNELRMKMKI